ncbi:MAG: sulfatase [Bacteroidota bacterium]|nr:sulfatase [Bacteroidota bacterium]
MTGRIPLLNWLSAALLLAVLASMPPADDRPNILLVIADDWSWLHAGAYGDSAVATPTLDRLAADGLVFEHAYVASPSCTPSRASVVTGKWFWRLGAGANLYGPLGAEHPVYPDLLEDNGYHVGFTRKGWAPGQLGERTRNPAGDRYASMDEFLAARPTERPFAFWFGTHDPHRGYELGSGVRSGIDSSRIQVPAAFPDVPAVRSDIADYYYEIQRIDRELAELLQRLEQEGELHRTLVVITSDNGMPFPRAKSMLYDLGTRVPLIMHWSGRIPPGRRVTDLVSLIDLAPTFLEVAGLEAPPVMDGRSLMLTMTSVGSGLIDSSRTAVFFGKERHVPSQASLDGGGYPMRAIRTHEHLYIRNFRPDRWPAGTPEDDSAFLSGAWYSDVDASPTKHHMIAHRYDSAADEARYDRAFARRSGEELYDLAADPSQLNNRALDPAYASVKRALWNQLLEQLHATGDPRVLGTGEFFDHQPYTGGLVRRPER